MIQNLTVIGPGLIGGSLIKALHENNAVENVVACSRDTGTLEKALKLGIIDSATTDADEAVVAADMVVIATPVGTIADIFFKIEPALKKNTVVTDVGSVKSLLINKLSEKYNKLPENFIPGHPVAGTEKSGIEAAFAGLFENRKVILTPNAESDPEAVDKVSQMWKITGAEVINMQAEQHDLVLAATSHLPHMLAYALVDQLSNMREVEDIFTFAAGGFRDLSRIASSDATMWRDICLSNKRHISRMLDTYKSHIDKLKQLLDTEDGDGLYDLFAAAKENRDSHFK